MKTTKKTAAVLIGIVALAGTAVAQMLPDLTVKDVAMDDTSRVTFDLANESSNAVDPNSDGFIYVYVDGKVAWTYNWKYLKETGFLNADGIGKITSQIPKGQGDVKVCIDAREDVTEADENNNCFEVKMAMDNGSKTPVSTGLPDLAVVELSIDPFSGNLVVEHGNIGKGHVPNYNGNLNIYVDGKLRWTYNFSSMNKQFFNPGFTALVTPGRLRGEHTVTACASTRDIIEEVSKENNCLTRSLTDVNPSGYVRTKKVERNNLVVYKRRNMDMPNSNQQSYYKPDFAVDDIYRNEDDKVYAVLSNKGVNHYQKVTGGITFYLDGRRQKSYLWTSFSDLGFLQKNGKSTLPVYEVSGAHEVKVCVDDTNKVQERSENNNCFSTLVK